MLSGKMIRLNRLTYKNRMLCIPLDHGITDGPVKGLRNIFKTINEVEKGGATAIIVHKGIIRSFSHPPNLGIIMHISASTTTGPDPYRKVIVGTVRQAMRLGADAVSVHVNVSVKDEPEMLVGLGFLSEQCDEMGMPLLAMMYPKLEQAKNPYDPEVVAHVSRIGAELGADIVKTVYTGDPTSFKTVVESCPVPVVIAGGPKCEREKDVLATAAGAIEAGAIGVSFGRNVFMHDNPRSIVKALFQVVIRNYSIEDAMKTKI